LSLLQPRIAVELQRKWADGTTHLVFTPGELLERLATLVPRPGINLLLYHGILAPNARWRRAVVPAAGEANGSAPLTSAASAEPASEVSGPRRRERPKYRAWADLRAESSIIASRTMRAPHRGHARTSASNARRFEEAAGGVFHQFLFYGFHACAGESEFDRILAFASCGQ